MKFWCPNYFYYSNGDRWFIPGSGDPWTTLYFWQGREQGEHSVVHMKARPASGCFYGGYHRHKLTDINVWYPGDKPVEDLLPEPGWDFGLFNTSLCYHRGLLCYVHIGTSKGYGSDPAYNNFEAWYDLQYSEKTGGLRGKYFDITETGAEALHPEDWDRQREVLFNLIDIDVGAMDGYRQATWASPTGIESPNGKLPPTVTPLFGEISGITSHGSPDSAVLQHTVEEAFVNAAAGAPRLNSNNLSNLKEIVSFCKDIGSGDFKRALDDFNSYLYDLKHLRHTKNFMKKYGMKSLKLVEDLKRGIRKNSVKGIKNAWLAYRYAYSTSALDATEVGEYVDYLTSCIGSPYHKLYGVASNTYAHVEYHVTLKTSLHSLNFRSTESYLLEYGLLPTPYVLWDMIPGSFVIDWFLPVGDILEAIDNIDYVNSAFELTQQTASVSYDMMAGDYQVHCYSRWLTAITHVDASALARLSNPVTVKRIADTLCLLR